MWYNIRYLKLIFFLHSLVILQEMTLMKPLLKRAFGNLPLKFSSYPYNQLFLNGPIPVSFCWFLSFSYYIFNNPNWKSVDTVLRIWIRGHWMVGADEITELWRPPILTITLPIEDWSSLGVKRSAYWPFFQRFEIETLWSPLFLL